MSTEPNYAALYPSMFPSQPAHGDTLLATGEQSEGEDSEPQPDPEQERAEKMFVAPEPQQVTATVPEHIAQLRKADPARQMFSPQKQYVDVFGRDTPLDIDPRVHAAVLAESREIFADFELSDVEARDVVGWIRRGEATGEQVDEWNREAEGELRRVYGANADQALADARALAARDPRVGQILDAFGAPPRIVLLLAEKARSLRGAGALG